MAQVAKKAEEDRIQHIKDTIIDDDETRKVNFGELTRSGDESVGEDTAFVVLTQDAPGSGVTVDYEILEASTATNGNVDYNIAASGTLNFASGEDSVMLIFDINDDILDEVDETIRFRLSNPLGNLNLGDDVDFIYTITDKSTNHEGIFIEPESFFAKYIPIASTGKWPKTVK